VLGEIKKNFPRTNGELDEKRKNEIFKQIKKYDNDLLGWPTKSEEVEIHDIALIVHLATSAYAEESFEKWKENNNIQFTRDISIIEFTRMSQAREFFLFRLKAGKISDLNNNQTLIKGIQIPYDALINDFSKWKIYDVLPPIPYFTSIIWEHVIIPKASLDPKYEVLRRNQIIDVTVTVKEVVDLIHKGFSFHSWHTEYPTRQPEIPHTDWVIKAFDYLVEINTANWTSDSKDEIIVKYKKLDDIHDYFVRAYVIVEEEKQMNPRLDL
jgi:uncharacterized protein YbcI